MFPLVAFNTRGLYYFSLTVFSLDELRKLSEDEDLLLQLVMELPQLQKIATDRQNICATNEALASESWQCCPKNL